MTTGLPKVYTAEEAAVLLGLSRSAIYDEIAAGGIEVHRLGRRKGTIRVTEGALVAYLEARKQPATRQTVREKLEEMAQEDQADRELLELAERGRRVKSHVRRGK